VSNTGRLDVLDAQQALLTDGIAQMLQGRWVGFPSLEADLMALDPSLTLDPHPPVLTSEAGELTPPFWLKDYNPSAHMPHQAASWTCSACALAWVLRATQVDPNASEQSMTQAIGTPQNINSTYGLMDGSGAQLQRVLGEYGVPSHQAWLNFDQVWAAAASTTGCMSGGSWYHWVAIRGQSGESIWIANSAPGYCGVDSTLSRNQFNQLGPFSVVLLG
jgi:hypothetical protein